MSKYLLNGTLVLLLTGSYAFAQVVEPSDVVGSQIDCSDPANAAQDECLGLPPGPEITNFAPIVAPLLAGAAIAAIGGGGSSDGTTSTTSTTSTTATTTTTN